MNELTDEQKIEAKRVVDCLMDYWMNKIEIKMENGMTFQVAWQELYEEILNEQ